MSSHAFGVAFGVVIALGIVVFGLVPLLWTARENRQRKKEASAQRPNANHQAP